MTHTDLRSWLEGLVEVEATIPARQVLDRLPVHEEQEIPPANLDPIDMTTWRERLWVVPGETRLGVHEVCEALGRSASWLYRHTSPKALAKSDVAPIPHRKLEGELTFLAGELRTWVRQNEASVFELPIDSTPAERALGTVSVSKLRVPVSGCPDGLRKRAEKR